jgi:Flp pilus assembly CpaE family ATPase
VVLNRVSKRARITPEDVEGVLGTSIFSSIPNDYGALEQAYAQGRLLEEGHRLRSAIGQLASRLTGSGDRTAEEEIWPVRPVRRNSDNDQLRLGF